MFFYYSCLTFLRNYCNGPEQLFSDLYPTKVLQTFAKKVLSVKNNCKKKLEMDKESFIHVRRLSASY